MTASDPARGERRRCLRSVGYYGNSQLLRPTVVLGAWTAAGATLILLGYLRQQRRLVQEAAD